MLKQKTESWQQYVKNINERTPITQIWKKFRIISGQNKTTPSHPLLENNQLIYEGKQKADIIGKYLAKISSENNLTQEFKEIKEKEEQSQVNFQDEEEHYYNTPITESEFNHVLRNHKNTAPGEDKIVYQMIKNSNKNTKEFILKFFNKIWVTGVIPKAWKHAIVIPILKPGKDPNQPSSFRPISLTSNLCKLLEKIINTRLTWYLRKNKLITKYQFGSQNQRSTISGVRLIE